MKKLLLLISLLLATNAWGEEISFDCSGTWNSSKGPEILTNKLDFDLEKLTGTRENQFGRIVSFYKVELSPKFLLAWEFESYNRQPEQTVNINRETLNSVVNGAIGTCKIVDRRAIRKF